MPQQWAQSELPTTVNCRSLFQSNSNFRQTRLHCFPPQQCHVPSCLSVLSASSFGSSVCLSIRQSIPTGWAVKATPLISGQLSKQDTPFTLTPRGRKAIDNSLSAVSQFVHFWNWPQTLLTHRPLTGVEWIRTLMTVGGMEGLFFKAKNRIKQHPYRCFEFQ